MGPQRRWRLGAYCALAAACALWWVAARRLLAAQDWEAATAAPLSVTVAPRQHPTCFEEGVDYLPGNGIPNATAPGALMAWPAASPRECQARCAASPPCMYWTYDAAGGTCAPKRDVLKHAPNAFWEMAPQFPTFPTPRGAAVVSGPRQCPAEVLEAFTKADLLRELAELEACSFPGLAAVAKQLRACAGGDGSPFVHWQVAHAGATHGGTYPRRAWEKCAVRNSCFCPTRVRHGVPNGDRWVVKDMDDGASVRCSAETFPHDPPLPPSAYGRKLDGNTARCECETSQAERAAAGARATYLTMTLRGVPRYGGAACDVPLARFSPALNRLSVGWGETAAHVAVGLASQCFPELRGRWGSVASWKQDEKLLQLPCSGLTAFPFAAHPGNRTALVYSQHAGDNWSRMPLNVSADVRAAIRDLFGVAPPLQLDTAGGKKGNRALPGWEARGWNHPCCQYGALPPLAHARFAKFFVAVTLRLADTAPPATAAAYCLLWRSSGACIPRWHGYLAEVLYVYYIYATQEIVAARPNSGAAECAALPKVTHPLHGTLPYDAIDAVYAAAVRRSP